MVRGHAHGKGRASKAVPAPPLRKLTVRHGEMVIFGSRNIEISVKFGGRVYPRMPFKQAAKFLRMNLRAERDAFQRQVITINQDVWLIGLLADMSEVLSITSPPDISDWYDPERRLQLAERALRVDDFKMAVAWFESAVRSFNNTHKRFMDYLEGLQHGAEIGITFMEITEVLLVGAAAEGFEVYLQSKRIIEGFSLIHKAGIAAGAKAFTDGVAKGVAGEFVFSKWAPEVLFEFASSLVGGALSEYFMNLVRSRVIGRRILLKQLGDLNKVASSEFAAVREELRKMINNAIEMKLIPQQVKHWESNYLAHAAQVLTMILGYKMVVLARKQSDQPMTPLEFISNLLDDLGNDEMEIIGKLLKLF